MMLKHMFRPTKTYQVHLPPTKNDFFLFGFIVGFVVGYNWKKKNPFFNKSKSHA